MCEAWSTFAAGPLRVAFSSGASGRDYGGLDPVREARDVLARRAAQPLIEVVAKKGEQLVHAIAEEITVFLRDFAEWSAIRRARNPSQKRKAAKRPGRTSNKRKDN